MPHTGFCANLDVWMYVYVKIQMEEGLIIIIYLQGVLSWATWGWFPVLNTFLFDPQEGFVKTCVLSMQYLQKLPYFCF